MLVAFICGGSLAACGGQALTASSPCQDYLSSPKQVQDSAVSRIAGEKHAGNAVTPLGRPNIDYLCANNTNMTLGQVIEATGGSPAKSSGGASDTSTPTKSEPSTPLQAGPEQHFTFSGSEGIKVNVTLVLAPVVPPDRSADLAKFLADRGQAEAPMPCGGGEGSAFKTESLVAGVMTVSVTDPVHAPLHFAFSNEQALLFGAGSECGDHDLSMAYHPVGLRPGTSTMVVGLVSGMTAQAFADQTLMLQVGRGDNLGSFGPKTPASRVTSDGRGFEVHVTTAS